MLVRTIPSHWRNYNGLWEKTSKAAELSEKTWEHQLQVENGFDESSRTFQVVGFLHSSTFYVEMEVTTRCTVLAVVITTSFHWHSTCSLMVEFLGWIVTFVISTNVRGGGPSSGYISAGFFGGRKWGYYFELSFSNAYLIMPLFYRPHCRTRRITLD